jgi:uncharacterized protein (TIGR03067 family)
MTGAALITAAAMLAVVGPTDADESAPEATRDARQDELVRKDMARLQGIWSMANFEFDGTNGTREQMKAWVLVVEGDQYNPGAREYSIEYTFRIKPGRTPKAIDLIPHDGSGRGRPIRGIYSIEGDTFILCRPIDPMGERPAGFTARPGSGLSLWIWKRQRTGATP